MSRNISDFQPTRKFESNYQLHYGWKSYKILKFRCRRIPIRNLLAWWKLFTLSKIFPLSFHYPSRQTISFCFSLYSHLFSKNHPWTNIWEMHLSENIQNLFHVVCHFSCSRKSRLLCPNYWNRSSFRLFCRATNYKQQSRRYRRGRSPHYGVQSVHWDRHSKWRFYIRWFWGGIGWYEGPVQVSWGGCVDCIFFT